MYFYSGIFCIIYVTRLDMCLPKPSTPALNVITAFYISYSGQCICSSWTTVNNKKPLPWIIGSVVHK